MNHQGITLSEKKPIPRGYILCIWFHYITFFKSPNYKNGGHISGAWGADGMEEGSRAEGTVAKGMECG